MSGTASEPASSFAPPRAGRAAGLRRFWFAYRRGVPTFRRAIPDCVTNFTLPWFGLIVGVVPLLGLHLASPPMVRRVCKVVAALCAFVALVYFDHAISGVALGIFAAIHALGVGDYMQAHWPQPRPWRRVLRRVGLALACAWCVLAGFPLLLDRVVVRVGDARSGAALIQPRSRVAPVVKGEMVAFRLPQFRIDHLQVNSGLYYGTVLAHAYEQVNFGPEFTAAFGLELSEAALLPTEGALEVPRGHVLVWPRGFMNRGFTEGQRRRVVERLVIPESALVGRPYTRWFWRTQTP